jgi:hypothetical protein
MKQDLEYQEVLAEFGQVPLEKVIFIWNLAQNILLERQAKERVLSSPNEKLPIREGLAPSGPKRDQENLPKVKPKPVKEVKPEKPLWQRAFKKD